MNKSNRMRIPRRVCAVVLGLCLFATSPFAAASGIDTSNPNSQAAALNACAELWFFQAAVKAMGSLPLTSDNFMQGVDKLGYSYSSPGAYATYFGPDQHDGIAAVRTSRFDVSCTCFTYTSVPYRVG